MNFNFDISTKIRIENVSGFREYLEMIKNHKVLLILSKTMEERFQLSDCIKIFEKENKCNRILKVSPNPTEKDIKNVLDTVDVKFDLVVAIGGGSAIDLAKGAIALSYCIGENYSEESILESIVNKEYLKYKNVIEFIAVPTTAGTGSEVTKWGTIWQGDHTKKLSVEADWLAPTSAVIIPEVTVKMPIRLTLSSGLDALSHATESYWSKKSNPISRELSKSAIRLIKEYLPKVIKEPDQYEYREKMCYGSLFAGLAFANTRTTACHSISYPLTMKHGVEHGFACAVTLTEVMKYNQKEIIEYDELLKAFGMSNIDEIKNWIDMQCSGIQELRLSAFGVDKKDIEDVVQNTFTTGRMDNNPVDLSIEDVRDILIKVK